MTEREGIASNSPEEIERLLRIWGEDRPADIEIYIRIALMYKQGAKQVAIAKSIGRSNETVRQKLDKINRILLRQTYIEIEQAKAETAYDR